MIINFEIMGTDELTPVMVAHQVGNQIGLPFEVVSRGNNDEVVELAIEISEQMIIDGDVESPFNQGEGL